MGGGALNKKMITSITIKNLGLIDDVYIELSESLNAITGETGAGKTMVLSAIDALLGRKISPSLVTSSDKTIIEAELVVKNPSIVNRLEELDIQIDEQTLIVSRSFSAEGKSKCLVGGRNVPTSILSELMGEMIFIHGQKDQQKMAKPQYALSAIDSYLGAKQSELLTKLTSNYRALQSLIKEREIFQKELSLQEANRERFQQMIEDIKAVSPKENEDEEIVALINNAQNIEKITTALAQTANLSQDDQFANITTVHKHLMSIGDEKSQISDITSRINIIIHDLHSISSKAATILEDISSQDLNIDSLESRRAKILRLMKLYGPSLADVLKNLEDGESILSKINDPGDYALKLDQKIDEQSKLTLALANEISTARTSAAKNLSKLITQELKDLMLAEAEFQVIVQKDELSATGIDTVDFSFRANQRLDFGPLSKVASGGELSRLMLALEVVLAQKSQQQTFIFDEVDTGVGGKTAIEIAKRLKKLSLVAQVVLVTHLPQIAAFADRNLVVEKTQTKGSVSTQVKEVAADAKVLEISRMLAGLEGSATALGHAEELIDMARSL